MAKRTSQNKNKRKFKINKNQKCYFTESNTVPDYKDVLVLRRFVSERGKLMAQKYSGLTAKHQRKLSAEVKKARFMGLIPYTERHAI